MKKAVLLIMVISMIFITGCGFGKDKQIENTEMSQKVVLIYEYVNYAESPTYIGFYVNSEGRKIQFDFSENAKNFLYEHKNQDFISEEDIYKLLLETEETESEEFMTFEDVSKCYKLLSKISTHYHIDEKCAGKDAGSYCWYGVLDDGENPPKFILLSEKGDWEGVNTDRNAKKIMKIIEKAE